MYWYDDAEREPENSASLECWKKELPLIYFYCVEGHKNLYTVPKKKDCMQAILDYIMSFFF